MYEQVYSLNEQVRLYQNTTSSKTLLVCEEIAEYCFLMFPSYYYSFYSRIFLFWTAENKFLNSLFTMNYYRYFIEIL